MPRLSSRHIMFWLLAVAAVVLGGVVLLCSSDAEAIPLASPQERCCCLVNPADQPPYALFVQQGGREREAESSVSSSVLPRHIGLPAPRARWEHWGWAGSGRPRHGQYCSGLAWRAPPSTPPLFALLVHV